MMRAVFVRLLVFVYTLALGIPAILIMWFYPHAVIFLTRAYFRLILATLRGVRIEVVGQENIPAGPCIFLSNHQSAIDIPALSANLPLETRFLAKRELGFIPIFGWAMFLAGHMLIDRKNAQRAKASLTKAAERLRKGKASLIAFPEGTRTRDGNLLPFKKGVFILAIQSGLPIVPVSIQGAFEVFPRKTFAYVDGSITVRIHPPVSTSGYTLETKTELIERVKQAIESGVKGGA